MIERRGPLRWLFWASLVLSVALHIGAVVTLFLPRSDTSGAADRPTTAISVNLETTDILDASEQSATMAAASAAPSPAPTEVKTDTENPEETPPEPPKPAEAEPKPAEPESQPQPSEPQPPEKTAQPAEEQPRPETDAVAELERERIAEEALRKSEAEEAERQQAVRAETERKQAERREAERQDSLEREGETRAERRRAEEREEARERERRRSRQRQNAGASGSQGKQASKGRVSASQGSIRNYGSAIRARIARNKPAGRNGRGSVVVAFALSSSGALISARVISSSGNASLDQSALAAVRRSSPFPAPPAGSSSGELRFTMPFHFR